MTPEEQIATLQAENAELRRVLDSAEPNHISARYWKRAVDAERKLAAGVSRQELDELRSRCSELEKSKDKLLKRASALAKEVATLKDREYEATQQLERAKIALDTGYASLRGLPASSAPHVLAVKSLLDPVHEALHYPALANRG